MIWAKAAEAAAARGAKARSDRHKPLPNHFARAASIVYITTLAHYKARKRDFDLSFPFDSQSRRSLKLARSIRLSVAHANSQRDPQPLKALFDSGDSDSSGARSAAAARCIAARKRSRSACRPHNNAAAAPPPGRSNTAAQWHHRTGAPRPLPAQRNTCRAAGSRCGGVLIITGGRRRRPRQPARRQPPPPQQHAGRAGGAQAAPAGGWQQRRHGAAGITGPAAGGDADRSSGRDCDSGGHLSRLTTASQYRCTCSPNAPDRCLCVHPPQPTTPKQSINHTVTRTGPPPRR